MNAAFWAGRSVFVTGHTGFKGAWLTLWLRELGARVHGFSLPPATDPSLFGLLGADGIASTFGDVRDLAALSAAMAAAEPEIVLHLAAQSLVRPSYLDPVGTYSTNVMGTVHLLEAVRSCPSARAVVVVTSDKCYENAGTGRPFRETDPLGGRDPYSNSKGCAELVTAAYRASFFGADRSACAVASARAGNVIGGGDWSADRLIPDMLRAHERGERVVIRSPDAVRPWQHVLEPLAGYLRLAEALCGPDGAAYAQPWNFGPPLEGCVPVRRIVEQFGETLGLAWDLAVTPQPEEAAILRIDASKAEAELGWRPRLSTRDAIAWTADWHRQLRGGAAARDVTRAQIASYRVPMEARSA